MKSNPINRLIVPLVLCLFGLLPFSALSQSGSFSDNFSVSHDYLNNGVTGTPWTGITAGVVSPGTVADWDANVVSNGVMTITNTDGAWDTAGDGPFLWSMVQGPGDFAVTLRVTNVQTLNYNFAGVMVRDPSTATQNYLYIAIFNEFNFNTIIRDTTNSVTGPQPSFNPTGYVPTNSATFATWLQITRVSGALNCYASLDGVTWQLAYSSPRTDLTNDLQVGLFNSTYSGNTCTSQYGNFSVTGPGVSNAPAAAAPASGLLLTQDTNSVDVSWTPGAGSSGSLVVVHANKPVTRQPINGTNYTGSATLGSGTNLGEGNYVAFVGTGNSFKLTNTQPAVNYAFAVYSYTNTGSTIVYSLTNTPFATNTQISIPIGITLVTTNAVAVDDTAVATVYLDYQGGFSNNVTTSATFASSTPAVATRTGHATFSALSAGTTTISVTYLTNVASNTLTVVQLPVTDNFSTPHDFLANSVQGTYWTGVLLSANDAPAGGAAFVPTQTLRANTDIFATNRLSSQLVGGGFGEGADTGFFLYKILSNNFSIAVQITQFDSRASNFYHMPGIMVRAPYSFQDTENFITITRFDNFSAGDIEQETTNFINFSINYPEPSTPFLMITRSNDTFNIYGKQHALDPWGLITSEPHPELDGTGMQVGLQDETFTGDTAGTLFANLCITNSAGASTIAALGTSPNAPAPPSGLVMSYGGIAGAVVANWTPGTGSTGSLIVAHPGGPATSQPVDGTDYSHVAFNDFTAASPLDLSSNILVYDGNGNTTPITSTPPEKWYFSVYSFANVGGTNYYNLNPSTASIDLGPITIGATNVVNGLQLSWSRGVLLEATNVLGPWTTNLSATSPFVVTNKSNPSSEFFRIQSPE